MVDFRQAAHARREGTWTPAQGGPKTVELVGPAGAGKSTLLDVLLARHPNIRPLLRTRALRRTPAIVRDLASFAPTALVALPTAPVFLSRNLRLLVRLETLQGALRHAQHDARGPVVFEHGPVYTLARLAAFHGAEPPSGPVASYLSRVSERWAHTLDVVIWLDAPLNVLTERVRQRPKAHRVKERDESAIHDFLDRYQRAYEGVLAQLQNRGRLAVIALRTDHDSATAMADTVAAILGENGHAR